MFAITLFDEKANELICIRDRAGVKPLNYYWEDDVLFYRWNGVVDGFEMPVRIADSDIWLQPTENWQKIELNKNLKNQFTIDRNFYIYSMQVK